MHDLVKKYFYPQKNICPKDVNNASELMNE